MVRDVEICLRHLPWLLALMMVCITGCLMAPTPIETKHGLPADKYDYLAMAVRLEIFARREPDAPQRAEFRRLSRKTHAVWNEPQKYKLPSAPSAWPQEEVNAMREAAHSEALTYLKLVLRTEESVPYEDDVRHAVEALSTPTDLPSESHPGIRVRPRF